MSHFNPLLEKIVHLHFPAASGTQIQWQMSGNSEAQEGLDLPLLGMLQGTFKMECRQPLGVKPRFQLTARKEPTIINLQS